MHICTVIEHATKFVTVINNQVIGTSRHKDYSLFHFKAHDVKALKVPISKFIFVDAKDEVDEVIEADQLKDRGVNYKTAKRDTAELTDVELAAVSIAIKLARAGKESGKKPKPKADTKPPDVHIPADGVPKVIITPEAAARGLADQLAQAESTQPAGANEAEVGDTAFDATATAAAIGEAAEVDVGKAAEGVADDGAEHTQVDDPLTTVKPSRKKRRR